MSIRYLRRSTTARAACSPRCNAKTSDNACLTSLSEAATRRSNRSRPARPDRVRGRPRPRSSGRGPGCGSPRSPRSWTRRRRSRRAPVTRSSCPGRRRDLAQPVRFRHVRFEDARAKQLGVLLVVTPAASPVVVREHVICPHRAGEDARGHRRVGQVRDAAFGEPRHQLGPVVLDEQRELVLHRVDASDRLARLDEGPVEVRDAHVACQAFVADRDHRPPRVLQRDAALIGPVQLVEVDVVEVEPLQRIPRLPSRPRSAGTPTLPSMERPS